MSSASISAEITVLRQCIADMERLEADVASMRRQVAERAGRFAGVTVSGAWAGRAADEFQKELDRAQRTVLEAAEEAADAVAIIQEEILKARAELSAKQIQFEAAVAFEAAQRRAAASRRSP